MASSRRGESAEPPRLRYRIAKRRDGTHALTWTRADGTSTWQRMVDGFFPLHDLTHYAVETTLGIDDAFFGLLARGWSVTDFAAPLPRGPIPAVAGWVELVVGALQTERSSGGPLPADEFNYWLEMKAAADGRGPPGALVRHLTDDELDRIRRRINELFVQWHEVPPGGSLELPFPDTAPTP